MRRFPLVFLPLIVLLTGCTGSLDSGYERIAVEVTRGVSAPQIQKMIR